MKDLTLAQYLDRLASSDPTPGGGAAAALAGASAASLVAMVCRLSSGKGGEDAMLARTLAAAEAERHALLDLAGTDAEAFDAVMQAMRLPTGTAEAKQRRQSAMRDALRHATEVPLDVAARAVTVLEAATELAGVAHRNVVSDAGVAALLAASAAQGALLNARINLQVMSEESYKHRAADQVRTLGLRADVLRDEALAAINKRLP